MSEYIQWGLIVALAILLDKKMKSYRLRKWIGLLLVAGGLTLMGWASRWAHDLPFESLPAGSFLIGLGLFFSRNKYRHLKPAHSPQPFLRAATMKLAPNFPNDIVMQQLLQLLHEEVGLPRHKTLHLETSINVDLDCKGADAKQLMDALEQGFAIDLADYDAYRYFDPYRYFQPAGYDVYFNQRAKDRSNKVPLTIGMLYKAMKDRHWDTQALENLGEYTI
ncbi:DUF1493 family protein [Pseudomonas yamanorum]|nr:DUF1493 family protein [Pseudomonas yamanorum]